MWFMQRANFGPALAEALKDRVLLMDDVEQQLYVIYLANDILFNRCPTISPSPSAIDFMVDFRLVLQKSGFCVKILKGTSQLCY